MLGTQPPHSGKPSSYMEKPYVGVPAATSSEVSLTASIKHHTCEQLRLQVIQASSLSPPADAESSKGEIFPVSPAQMADL